MQDQQSRLIAKPADKTEIPTMKAASLITTIAAGVLLVIASGCGKKEQAPQPPAGQQQPAVQTEQATAQSDAEAEAKAQAIINRAWDLVGEGKYREAQQALNQLSGMKLTPAQQRGVEALRSRIQAGLSAQQGR